MAARDSSVLLEVALVANDDDGDVFVVLDSDDLFAEFGEFVERGEAGY